MGNSNGSLSDYWAAFRKYRGLQGGYVWDWIDQGLARVDAAGHPYFAYGGDFGETPHDANFCINGLVGPDGVPHPALFELKRLVQPIRVRAIDAPRGRLEIHNEQDFTDLRWLRGRFTLDVDGRVVQRGRLARLTAPPGSSQQVQLSLRRPVLSAGETARLTLTFETNRDLPWAPRGHEVAWEQIEIPWRPRALPRGRVRKAVPVDLVEAHDRIEINSKLLELVFDKSLGQLTSLVSQGRRQLLAGPQLAVWRAATDNDGIKALGGQEWKPMGRWQSQGLADPSIETRSIRTRQREGAITVTIDQHTLGIDHVHRYRVGPDGEVFVTNTFVVPEALDDLPRLGVELTLPASLDRLRWLGRGPHESYPDRKVGARFGRFESRVADEYVPYVVPQEHGHHTDTRWLELCDASGFGLRFASDAAFGFSASHYRAAQLFAAAHTSDLRPSDAVHLHLDRLHRGLGTGSCGPDTLPRYRIRPGRYRFAYSLSVVGSASTRSAR
jgi:beta-galactosidase